MCGHEAIIIEMRVGPANPVDLFRLACAQTFIRVEAPDTLQQTLAAQDFVNAGQPTPKRKRPRAAPGGGLEIKADQRDDFCDGSAMGEQLFIGRAWKRRQAQKTRMIPEFAKKGCFA